MKNFKLISLSLCLLFFTAIQAANTGIIPYQGSIANSSGTPYSGNFNFEFSIQNTAGLDIWNSGTVSLSVNLGAYSVQLGAAPMSLVPDSIWKVNDSLFLEISFNDGVNGLETLAPRVSFLYVPHAITAKYAEELCSDSLDLTTITSSFAHITNTFFDTINTPFIHINNLVVPGDEFIELDKSSVRLNCPTGTLTTSKTPAGGSIKAMNTATGDSVKIILDALENALKVLGGPIVLPNPFGDEEAHLEEDLLRFENDQQEMEQALDALGGVTRVTETATAKEVAQFLDAINSVVGTLSETTEHSNGGNMGKQEVIDDLNNVIHTSYNDGGDNITTSYDPTNGVVVTQGALEEIMEAGAGMSMSTLIDTGFGAAQIMVSNGINNVGFQFDPQGQTTFHQGNLTIQGILAKLGGTFKIDHPQDPYNKYLVHSFVESPDMMNIYNGNISTDEEGFAIVEMPAYFEALNMDFRYQLTVIGDFAQAIVSEEIDKNTFVLRTDKPNVKVSWQITGVRQDTFAQENRVQAEVAKEGNMVGKLLYEPQQVSTTK